MRVELANSSEKSEKRCEKLSAMRCALESVRQVAVAVVARAKRARRARRWGVGVCMVGGWFLFFSLLFLIDGFEGEEREGGREGWGSKCCCGC